MVILLGGSHLVFSQSDFSNQSRREIANFSFMVGEWEGTGIYFTQSGQEEFTVQEFIRYEIDSTILLLEGIGTDKSTNKKKHHAMAILYYDLPTQSLKLHSHISTGQSTVANVEKTGGRTFTWWFELPNGGKVSYEASFENEIWEEKGLFITQEGTRYPTMQMTLHRRN